MRFYVRRDDNSYVYHENVHDIERVDTAGYTVGGNTLWRLQYYMADKIMVVAFWASPDDVWIEPAPQGVPVFGEVGP